MDNKAPLYPHWTRTHVLAASVSIIAVYLGMRLLNNLLALPAGYALPLFPPAGVGLVLAAAGACACCQRWPSARRWPPFPCT
ncbi:hypothetical protein G4G28_23410 [Massilia sp. Dwa41.01b]|uniref:hypothetical protein n=1 Tax=Massilia sp. Dwa41.01b TaxID=2709302 RepID=UPI0016012EBC|nr:hypothetical protein [Massilia sp. Dwa41.01b]QNA90721.1 hypothetical protein G4G28_23410 [Massilia sp. Dwa41.01b]